MEKGALYELAKPGAEIVVRVTPKSSRNRIICKHGLIRVYVTTVPQGGKATRDVVKLLARAGSAEIAAGTAARGHITRQGVRDQKVGAGMRLHPRPKLF